MSTADHITGSSAFTEGEWRISGKALDRLQAFMAGIDDILIRVALEIAKKNSTSKSGRDLRIDAEEIEQAGNLLLERLLSGTNFPSYLRPDIERQIRSLLSRIESEELEAIGRLQKITPSGEKLRVLAAENPPSKEWFKGEAERPW
jgi:hypothetical protein